MLEAEEDPPVLKSSCHFSRLRLLAFMKKLLTVVSSKPSCWEMVICISLDGRLFSLKMAKSVLRWRSVKTRRDFFWELFLSLFGSCSLRLHAASLKADILWNSGSCSHFHILLNVSLPDFSLLQGLGFLSRSERVP